MESDVVEVLDDAIEPIDGIRGRCRRGRGSRRCRPNRNKLDLINASVFSGAGYTVFNAEKGKTIASFD